MNHEIPLYPYDEFHEIMEFPMKTHGFDPAWLLYINRFGSKTCNVATGGDVDESWYSETPRNLALKIKSYEC